MFNKSHIGQQVSDPRFGNGVIINFYTEHDAPFPVIVKFNTDFTHGYTPSGSAFYGQLPTLQFGPLTNWERRTQPELQDGQIIEVELTSGYWRLARAHIIDGLAFMSYDCRPDGSVIKYPLNHNWRCVH